MGTLQALAKTAWCGPAVCLVVVVCSFFFYYLSFLVSSSNRQRWIFVSRSRHLYAKCANCCTSTWDATALPCKCSITCVYDNRVRLMFYAPPPCPLTFPPPSCLVVGFREGTGRGGRLVRFYRQAHRGYLGTVIVRARLRRTHLSLFRAVYASDSAGYSWTRVAQ